MACGLLVSTLSVEEQVYFAAMVLLDPSGQTSFEVFGLCESAGLGITTGLHNAKDQRLKFLQMAIADRQIDAEPIPLAPVSIPKVMV
jgi:hypothetical protein